MAMSSSSTSRAVRSRSQHPSMRTHARMHAASPLVSTALTVPVVAAPVERAVGLHATVAAYMAGARRSAAVRLAGKDLAR